MNNPKPIKLFATASHPCSYLEGKEAKTIFVDPEHIVDEQCYFELNRLGFRRSGSHFYRPQCSGCQACIPTRLEVARFKPSRSQKRTLKINQDLQIRECTGIEDFDKHFELFEKYIRLRHADGDMYPANTQQFQQFINGNDFNTCFTEIWLGERLVGVSVKDRLIDGWSAIYTYFDPDESQRRLGVFAILNMIQSAQANLLSFVYLGYWIEDAPKMSYKADYQPLELFIDEHWQPFR